MDQATGPLADAIDRDLFVDGKDFDDLGWRGLWAYVTKAPPGTAIHYQVTEGWTIGAEFALEQVNLQRELNWRYTALHFTGGSDVPFPTRITRESLAEPAPADEAPKTLEELVPAHVRALIQGG